MTPLPRALSSLLGVALLSTAAMGQTRPKLQILNDGPEPVEIFWLSPDGSEVSNGVVPPKAESTITTSPGHRFALKSGGLALATVTSEVPVQAYRHDPRAKDGIPAFYTQVERLHGFPIVASAEVNPYALKEAVYIGDLMLGKRRDLLQAMVRSGARLIIIGHAQSITDLPEFARMRSMVAEGFEDFPARDYWDARARATGGSESDALCTCSEEKILDYPGNPSPDESILIHEFAHNIHLRGMVNVDPGFDPRLKAAYDEAMARGLWKGKYASVNHHEYFAEGVQSWFDNNRENDHDHNHVNTRAELIAYDPALAELCREVFGDTEVKYTKPSTRLHGHLAGYDPAKAPRFAWDERLTQVRNRILSKAQARSEVATAAKDQVRTISGWTVNVQAKLLATSPAETEKALGLLEQQLKEIERVVPAGPLAELRKVPLWFTPGYPGIPPRAEYHPGAKWLADNGRDPAMAKGVEFTNVTIFEAETRRMPNFALHELAHAYHDRVLGFDEARIAAAYAKAKESGSYAKVERRDAEGRSSHAPAYAMTNPQEYFAETTEAYFSRNDFFPFTRAELEKHDPGMFALLAQIWAAPPPP